MSEQREAAVEKDAKYLERECSEGLVQNPKIAAVIREFRARVEANRAVTVYRDAANTCTITHYPPL